ncbi:MAG: ParB/RepB/Spo0J family partition protein [Spirochaetales bacterium]
MSKRALGKGIDALFQSVLPEGKEVGLTQKSTGYEWVKLNLLVPNPHQPRKEFSQEALEELAASIRSKGVLQPLLVEKQSDNSYLIIAGERRYRAAQLAGLSEVPVIVRSFSEEEKLEIALIENLQREDLTPIEEAKAYRAVMDSAGLSQEELSERIGKNRSTIANSLRLLKLPEDMQEALHKGEITAGHARAILSVVNPADMRILFHRIVSKDLSVREAEALAGELNRGVRAAASEKEPSYPKQRPLELQEMEQRLLNVLGTKVRIRGNGKKGVIEISYFSSKDLERILEILEGQ